MCRFCLFLCSFGTNDDRTSSFFTILSHSLYNVCMVVLANRVYGSGPSADKGSVHWSTDYVLAQCLKPCFFFQFAWYHSMSTFFSFQFRIPPAEMERLTQADNPSAQKRVLEIFAKDLPISNRYVVRNEDKKQKTNESINHSVNRIRWHIYFCMFSFCFGRTMNGSLRYCDKCMVIKPDRAHHCSVCGMCVLKMDHHCRKCDAEYCIFHLQKWIIFLFVNATTRSMMMNSI